MDVEETSCALLNIHLNRLQGETKMKVEIKIVGNFYIAEVIGNKGIIARSAGCIDKNEFIGGLKEFITKLEEKRIWSEGTEKIND